MARLIYKEKKVSFYPFRVYYTPIFLTLSENGLIFKLMIEQSVTGKGLTIERIKKIAGKGFSHQWPKILEVKIFEERSPGLFYLKCIG